MYPAPIVMADLTWKKIREHNWNILAHRCPLRHRVSDPHWFNADPDTDPAFFLIADPDSGSGPGSGSRVDDLKLEKIYRWKFNFDFWSKIAIYLSLGLHKKLQEKPSALKREHPALQNMKILYFFLFLWVIFALLDPDPQFECGSGSGPDPESKSGQ